MSDHRLDHVLLDIDGVLTVSWAPLPGAVATIAWLRANDIGFRLVTNTSSQPRRRVSELLADAGMPVETGHILTAVTSAARYLREHYPGARCLVFNDGDLGGDLDGVEVTGDAADADVVLLGGAGPDTDYVRLDAVFKLADAGVPLVAMHRNARYQTADGPALDMGALIAAIGTATDIHVEVVGKPAPTFWAAALGDLGAVAATTVMVGDDVVSDVLGAQAVGITGVLVRTGKFRTVDLDGDRRPDHVIDGIGDLPALLGESRSLHR